MTRGRIAFPRWTVAPKDGSHPGILVGALTGAGAIAKARKVMKSKGWNDENLLLQATQTYNY